MRSLRGALRKRWCKVGFSLLEVIIAMAILMLSYLTLLELLPTTNRAARQSKLYVMASHFARSLMEQCIYSPPEFNFPHYLTAIGTGVFATDYAAGHVYDVYNTGAIFGPDFTTNGTANYSGTNSATAALLFNYDVYWTPLVQTWTADTYQATIARYWIPSWLDGTPRDVSSSPSYGTSVNTGNSNSSHGYLYSTESVQVVVKWTEDNNDGNPVTRTVYLQTKVSN